MDDTRYCLQLEVAEGQAPAMGPDGEVSVSLWKNAVILQIRFITINIQS